MNCAKQLGLIEQIFAHREALRCAATDHRFASDTDSPAKSPAAFGLDLCQQHAV
jgi:hypothetical protein